MAVTNPHQIYQQNAVQTASPERLLLMLFDGAIRFINLAKANFENNDMEQVHVNLVKAQAIFNELMVTLDMNYEISHQLYPLYDFCKYRLIEANIKKACGPIDEVLQLTIDMKKTWDEAIRIAKKGQAVQA